MNLLKKLTITNLKLNKKRTIVTIIGIILATALITGVATLVSSYRATMINNAKTDVGNFHYEYKDVPSNELKYIKNNRNVDSYYITQKVGYAYLKDSANDYKPYLYLMAYDDKALENSSIKLLEGRMPKNDNEIVISDHISENADVEYKIGEKITLNIGKRVEDGYELGQENSYNKEGKEKIEKEFTKTYEIVGIIERPNMTMEPRTAPGYTIITYLNDTKIEGKADIYTLYNKEGLRNRYKVTADILNIPSDIFEKVMQGNEVTDEYLAKIEEAKYEYASNEYLLGYEVLEISAANLDMIYGVGAIIIIIIIVSSVFCIRNSFAISITEKMKQYGMLASVGATSKQIKKNVLYEALVLAVIGIPIGISCGILAIFILLKVVVMLLAESLADTVIMFKVSWVSVILAVILSMITILLSARKSAKRASKVSPIEAIRSNEDIKIKSKKVKSPKIIKKLFGVGGSIAYKNLKRNKKKYRTTVVSIVVSVSIFIAMSSFMNYAFKVSSIYYKNKSYNLIVYGEEANDYKTLKEISKFDGIDKESLHRHTIANVKTEELKYSEKGKKYMPKINEKEQKEQIITVISLGEEEYKRYIKELGLKYDEVKDKLILIDDIMEYVTAEDGKGVYQNYNIYEFKPGDKINLKLNNEDKVNEITKKMEIVKKTDKRPMGLENSYSDNGFLIVSDEWMNSYSDYVIDRISLYVQSNDADTLAKKIEDMNTNMHVSNMEKEARQEKALWTVIAIFLYGFIAVISLIGITNIFNTITTNMNLRSKEFANLKSIGMTKKEFNKMIRLESVFYGTKSLIIGIPVGIVLSYAIYKSFAPSMETEFIFPTSGVVISIIAVFILILGIMHYSLRKINKQNIIETIRKDNI